MSFLSIIYWSIVIVFWFIVVIVMGPFIFENYTSILDGIYDAVPRLFQIGVAYFVFVLGKSISHQCKSQRNCYLTALGIGALLGFASYSDYGTHIENADPLYGSGGQTVQDIEPTDDERIQHGVVIFVISSTLLAIGAKHGFRQKVNEEIEHKIWADVQKELENSLDKKHETEPNKDRDMQSRNSPI